MDAMCHGLHGCLGDQVGSCGSISRDMLVICPGQKIFVVRRTSAVSGSGSFHLTSLRWPVPASDHDDGAWMRCAMGCMGAWVIRFGPAVSEVGDGLS